MYRFVVALLVVVGAVGVARGAAAQTCVANVPHVDGQWVTLPYLMPINPASATLLHDGRILLVVGSENDSSNNAPGSEGYRWALWDPTVPNQNGLVVNNIDYDVFCSGTAVLPDGRPLVVGGTSDYSFAGDNRASIFDPATASFLQSASMVDGRWYGTATALGDGRIMAFSGIGSGSINNSVEIYDLGNGAWTSPVNAPFGPGLYPRMVLLTDGSVFFTGQGDRGPTATSWIFDPAAGTWAPSAATTSDRHYGSAVLLPLVPPGYRPWVMNFGGGDPGTNSTELIDLSAGSPSWTSGPSMSAGRIQMNAVILPSGKVLAMGGSLNNEQPDAPGRGADLYDPTTNTFSSAGTAAYSRLYHSTALLLPDATVMSIGSNPGSRGGYEPAIEIYTPAYLFDANDRPITAARPSITGVPPGPIGYGAPFTVTYTSASAISSAVLVRPGSTTHAFDMEQRLIGLCGPSPQPPCTGTGTLHLISPPNGNVAPPGYYMLFLLDSAGVPSRAQFIQLSPYTGAPPRGTVTAPAADTTIPAGGTVSFGTSTVAAGYSWVFPGGSPATSTAQNPGAVTFDTAGCYVASLTVIDGSGNSDPSPPTRMIEVTPPSADFEIDVSPQWQAVLPGQSTSFTVTVTPLAGFSGPVDLSVDSESGFPAGITSGGFAPPSITGSGSSVLTMNTTVGATPYALTLTVKGTAGTITHQTSTSLLVILAAPASLTASPGNAKVNLTWSAVTGATSYHVKRALAAGDPYVPIACTTSTSYVDTGLVNGTTYYYVVSAASTGGPDGGGESTDSGGASATPHSPSTTTTSTTTTTTTSTAAPSTTSTTTSSTTTTAAAPTSTTTRSTTSTTASTTQAPTTSSPSSTTTRAPTTTTTSSTTQTIPAETTTTTTLAPGGCVAPPVAPTFASLDCRLDALMADVRSSAAIRGERRYLLHRLARAERRTAVAQGLCRASDGKAARDRLKRAMLALTRFGHRLQSSRGADAMPSVPRAELMVAGKGIKGSLGTLRRALRCPEAVVATPTS